MYNETMSKIETLIASKQYENIQLAIALLIGVFGMSEFEANLKAGIVRFSLAEKLILSGYTENFRCEETSHFNLCEMDEGFLFVINGYTFFGYTDGDDGYRSYHRGVECLGKINIVKNTFPGVEVKLEEGDYCDKFSSVKTGETLLHYGTDYDDEYYPQGFYHFEVGNLQKEFQ